MQPNKGFWEQLRIWQVQLEVSRKAFRQELEPLAQKDLAAAQNTGSHAHEQLDNLPKPAEDTPPVLGGF